MIYLGPEPTPACASTHVEHLAVDRIFSASAEEVERIGMLMSRLEACVMTAHENGYTADTLSTLQSIDLIQQSMSGLGRFLTVLADGQETLELPVREALAQVTLADMRNRLATAPHRGQGG